MLRTSCTPHTGGTRTSAAECKSFHFRVHRGTLHPTQSKPSHTAHVDTAALPDDVADADDVTSDTSVGYQHRHRNAARDAGARQHQRIRDLAARMALDAHVSTSQPGYNVNVFDSSESTPSPCAEPLVLPHTELRPPPAHVPQTICHARKWTYDDVLARLR